MLRVFTSLIWNGSMDYQCISHEKLEAMMKTYILAAKSVVQYNHSSAELFWAAASKVRIAAMITNLFRGDGT